jgi:Methyltransferase domain
VPGHGLDLTEELCAVSRVLTERTGLSGLIEVRQGDALDLPFPDASFDVVWSQHASMNIRDKRFRQVAARRAGATPPLGLHLVVPDLASKAANLGRNIAEDRVRLLQTVAG